MRGATYRGRARYAHQELGQQCQVLATVLLQQLLSTRLQCHLVLVDQRLVERGLHLVVRLDVEVARVAHGLLLQARTGLAQVRRHSILRQERRALALVVFLGLLQIRRLEELEVRGERRHLLDADRHCSCAPCQHPRRHSPLSLSLAVANEPKLSIERCTQTRLISSPSRSRAISCITDERARVSEGEGGAR